MGEKEDEFVRFFRGHYEAVVRSLTMVLADRAQAEDVAQVAFERAFRRWRHVSGMRRPATWVYVVAVRQARRSWRGPDHQVGQDPPAPASDPTEAMWVRRALAALPPRQRAAVVLRHLAGLSVAETAAAMGCAEGTVKASVHAALAKLRVNLEEEVAADAP